MKERPIIFSGPMVQAILDGRKTQTRRVIKLPIIDPDFECELTPAELRSDAQGKIKMACPIVRTATHLWVRESFYLPQFRTVWYRADWLDTETRDPIKWKSARCMPRAYCRITLEITEVRVQRLQDITEEDALAEGVDSSMPFLWRKDEWQNQTPNRARFAALWNTIQFGRKNPGGFSWEHNPWVFVISFKRV